MFVVATALTPAPAAVGLAMLALAACADSQPDGQSGQADVQVVDEPVVVADPDLSQVYDVMVDVEDRIWVLTPFPPIVRVYDRDGTRVGAFGVYGGGPTEFATPWNLVDGRAQGVGVVDTGRGVVRYFALNGALLSERAVRGGPQLPSEIHEGYFGDLGWTWEVDGAYLQDRYPAGASLRMSQAFDFWAAGLVLVPHDGSGNRTLVEFPDFVELPQETEFAPRPLSAGPLWDLCPDDEFVFQTGAASELVRIGMDGGVRSRSTVTLPLEPVDRDLAARWMYEVVSRLDVPDLGSPESLRERTEMMADLAEPYFEQTVPPTRLRCDANGRVWIQLFDIENDPRGYAREWVVVGRDGALLAEVTFPGGFHPVRFEEDRVVGVLRDGLDVETVGWVPLPTVVPGVQAAPAP